MLRITLDNPKDGWAFASLTDGDRELVLTGSYSPTDAISSVLVYVDSNAQQLNTKHLAVGTVFRFNGLLFNDSGTPRLDCAQINDGVPE